MINKQHVNFLLGRYSVNGSEEYQQCGSDCLVWFHSFMYVWKACFIIRALYEFGFINQKKMEIPKRYIKVKLTYEAICIWEEIKRVFRLHISLICPINIFTQKYVLRYLGYDIAIYLKHGKACRPRFPIRKPLVWEHSIIRHIRMTR